MTVRGLLALAGATVLVGCARRDATPPTAAGPAEGPFGGTDPWLLSTRTANAARGNHGIFLGNGLIGITLGAFGFDARSRCHIAGIFAADETLADIPLFPNKGDVATGTPQGGYEQSLDMRTGILRCRIVRTDAQAAELEVFPSRQAPNLLVMHAVGSAATAFLAAWTPPGTVRPGRRAVHFAIERVGDQSESTVFLAAVRDGDDPNPREAAQATARAAATAGYTKVRAGQCAAWDSAWRTDIRIEGDPEAQQMLRKALFDLRQCVRANSDDSIAPEGLSGSFYKGHIFWDAEIWMFPPLLALDPASARAMLDYRFRHWPAYRRSAASKGFDGADVAWESAATGRETAPRGFSEGRHVTAAVGWAVARYFEATRDRAWMRERGWAMLRDVANHFVSRAVRRGAKFSLPKVTGPDELEMGVDDNAYTNALVIRVLRDANAIAREMNERPDPRWIELAQGLQVPFDPKRRIFLKHSRDNGRKTKQADGELLLWPVRHPMDAEVERGTFDFHRARPIRNGPAMTSSIHALVAARLGLGDVAETAFRESYRPFVRGPFLLFSEKRSLDRCVFTTGLGGLLQSVLFGFGGLELHGKATIQQAPVLPKSWDRLEIVGLFRDGEWWDLTVDAKGRRWRRWKERKTDKS
ncbi:MAG: hypothetical protein ACKO5K_08100 [Armatimonadota bacterium]